MSDERPILTEINHALNVAFKDANDDLKHTVFLLGDKVRQGLKDLYPNKAEGRIPLDKLPADIGDVGHLEPIIIENVSFRTYLRTLQEHGRTATFEGIDENEVVLSFSGYKPLSNG